MNFRSIWYSGKNFDKFLDRIKATFGSDILIRYGDWSACSRMGNVMPTMIEGLSTAIHKIYYNVLI